MPLRPLVERRGRPRVPGIGCAGIVLIVAVLGSSPTGMAQYLNETTTAPSIGRTAAGSTVEPAAPSTPAATPSPPPPTTPLPPLEPPAGPTSSAGAAVASTTSLLLGVSGAQASSGVTTTTALPDLVTLPEVPIEALPATSTSTPTTSIPAQDTTADPLFDPNATVTPVSDQDLLQDEVALEAPPPAIVAVLLPPAFVRGPNINLQVEIAKLTIDQQTRIAQAQAKVAAATARVAAAQLKLDQISVRVQASRVKHDDLKRQIERTELLLRHRAIDAYTGDQVDEADVLLTAGDVETLAFRTEALAEVQRQESRRLDALRARRREYVTVQTDLANLLSERQRELVGLQNDEKAIGGAMADIAHAQNSVETGKSISLGDFTFPVQLPASFADTFGAPRMTGTKYAHGHEGVDIFAPHGTPLFACVRGIVTRVGIAPLGGNRLWITGTDGTSYYYAHLSAYAPTLYEGKVVEAGELVGYVGTTGNAAGTPAHVHYEIHPGGGPAINPTPIMRAVYNADAKTLVQALRATQATRPDVARVGPSPQSSTSTPTTAVTEVRPTGPLVSANPDTPTSSPS